MEVMATATVAATAATAAMGVVAMGVVAMAATVAAIADFLRLEKKGTFSAFFHFRATVLKP
jgi:hypothetical protein